MSVFTVQAPLGPLGEVNYEKAVFLREGFSFSAFIFGFLWLLWRQLWLIAIAWLFVVGFFGWLASTYLSSNSFLLIILALRLWLGLEGHALVRYRLSRREYQFVGVIEASSRDAAERQFFARLPAPSTGPYPAPPPPPMPHHASGHSDVLGVFPQPEMRR